MPEGTLAVLAELCRSVLLLVDAVDDIDRRIREHESG
jgi:hypothetical protein